MKTNITMHYILMFSYELRRDEWEIVEHEQCIKVHHVFKDIQIIIPKQLDELNTIDLWRSGTLLDSFGTITMLDMYLKGLLK